VAFDPDPDPWAAAHVTVPVVFKVGGRPVPGLAGGLDTAGVVDSAADCAGAGSDDEAAAEDAGAPTLGSLSPVPDALQATPTNPTRAIATNAPPRRPRDGTEVDRKWGGQTDKSVLRFGSRARAGGVRRRAYD
jgi:hypothetical protein